MPDELTPETRTAASAPEPEVVASRCPVCGGRPVRVDRLGSAVTGRHHRARCAKHHEWDLAGPGVDASLADMPPPALTPEQWARATASLDAAAGLADLAELAGEGTSRTVAHLALANAALPHGHPNKFTGADVAALRRLASEAGARAVADQAALDALAAKLAALLPPEGS